VATKNPTPQPATNPLPDGHLDRFAIALRLGDHHAATERRVVREQLRRATVDDLAPVVAPEELRGVQAAVRDTHIAEAILDYAVNIVRATRAHPGVRVGASSRAALALARCAQARAVVLDREYVLPDDVKLLAPFVLGHRLVLHRGHGQRPNADSLGAGAAVVAEAMAGVPVPVRRD
jgi:MoxR-like ATPase